ncbi:MAG TPA: glycerol-3-phosphate cytidylyltransferase [Virgibacillus sp.]|nr:glycerol-3-phosphate cytidylyltransferase [Virgibacillus sp.]
MKTIITYGTFDLLHSGHINLLRRAKELGDYLIVGISTDAFNRAKEKQAFHRYHERKLIIDAIRYVDQTIPEDSWDQKRIDIKKYNIHTIVMGDDWEGKFDDLKKDCNVVYLPRTAGISTSEIKQTLFHFNHS